jgi:predicted dehydrogenase
MIGWPPIDYGHTADDKAVTGGDVYGLRPDRHRLAKRPLKIALIGCGGVAQAKWLPAVKYLQTRSEPVTIAGVFDISADARAKVATIYSVPACPDVETLLAHDRPDLVLVLVSDDAHVPSARTAIDAGIPVLVEKPLSRSLADARTLCAYAEQKGVLIAGVANKRFSPPYAMAKALNEQDRLRSAPTLFSGKFTLGYPYVDLLEGGTIHLVDLALWFMGSPKRVHAMGTRTAEGRVEHAVAHIEFASGSVGSIVTSSAAMSFKPWERVEIVGRNAMLAVEDQLELSLYDEEVGPAKVWRPAIPNTLMFDEEFGGYAGLLAHVLDAVRGDVALSCTGWSAAAAVELIEALKLSLETRAPVTLPLAATPLPTPSETAR